MTPGFTTPRPRSVVAVLAAMLTAVLIGPIPGYAAQPGTGTVAATTAAPANEAATTDVITRCAGNLPFGRVISCAAITGTHKDVFRITTTADNDLIFTSLGRSAGEWVSAQVTAPDGTVVCFVGVDAGTCQLGAAGTYKLTLSLAYGTGTGNYTISAESLRTPSACKALGSGFFSFASPGVAVALAQGSAGRCLSFDQPTGSLLYPAVFSYDGYGYLQGTIYDAQGQPVCPIGGSNCALTSAGPYRLFFHDYYGGAITVTVRMPRISAPTPAGCPVVPVRSFGDQGTYATSTAPVGFANCQRVRAHAAGTVNIRFSPSQSLGWTLYSETGTVVCNDYEHLRTCPVPAAGDYALVVQNRSDFGEPITYQTAVTALDADAGCAPVTTSAWDQDAITVHQTAGPQVNCQPFQGEAGDRIMVYRAPDSYNDLYAVIVDATGAVVCPGYSDQDGCVLPATGRYRVVSFLGVWDAQTTDATYRMQVRRLNEPQGCPSVTPGAYNEAPAGALGAIRCRILDIPAPGVYTIKPVDAANNRDYFALYHADGTKANYCGIVACTIPAAGKYTLVLGGSAENGVIDSDHQYALALLGKAAGCSNVATDPAAATGHDGQFATAGQYDCVQLDAAAGTRVVLLEPNGSTGTGRPEGAVYDADGNYVCESPYPLRQESCELTGTAPFSFVYSAPDGAATGPYSMRLVRVSGDSGCAVLPQSATGVTVTSSAGHYSECFSIPADQHAASETFSYQVTGGTGTASIAVYNANGYRYCGSILSEVPSCTMRCTLPAGAYTLLVQTVSADGTVRVSHQAAS